MSTLDSVELAAVESASEHLNDQTSIESGNHCDTQSPNKTKTNPIHRSSWAYLKWFVWVAVTGLFHCGVSAFEAAFDYHWLSGGRRVVASNLEAAVSTPYNSEGNEPQRESTPLNCNGCSGGTNSSPKPEPLILDHEAEERDGLPCVDSPADTSSVNGVVHCADECLFHPCSRPVWYTEDQFSPGLNCNDPTDSTVPSSFSFTLLNSFYAESKKGIIDPATRDLFVDELLKSVIPRNLSDSSEVSVTPAIRKMYAWTDPKAYPETSVSNDPLKPSAELQFAYPGKLTMSDSSFSPLSPGTAESNTPTGERSQTPSDFDLPDIDRQDQTFAWAMTNLKVSQEMRTELQELIGTGSEPAPTAVCTGRPPLPTARERQSRERSPVTTINSARLTDTLSLPTFAPFEGRQMFDEESSSVMVVEEVPKPKRSSSLKSTRTPPGTPRQKAVRFADTLGLDLATVRHVFDQENPPKIPASATFDLQLDSDECIAKLGAKQFGLCFAQPGAASNFIRRVLNETVCLEDCHVDMPRGVLTGTIRVKSLGFEKHIAVRITYNNWVTFFDSQASYVQGSHDGATDRFSFSVIFPDTMVPGDRAQFAIRYETHTGEQFWDNNHGQNYCVTCYAKATDLAGDGSWVHYL